MDVVIDLHQGHTGSGAADLGPGDRLVLPPHTPHAAIVTTDGRLRSAG